MNRRDIQAKDFLATKISELTGLPLSEAYQSINIPELEFGDYASNIAFRLAKTNKTAPLASAEELAAKLLASSDFSSIFSSAQAVQPGFINFSLSHEHLGRVIADVNLHPDAFGAALERKKELALIEYFQLNVAKPPHVGHLRSAIIGDSLKRIFISQGYKTVSDTHIGDWGTQFGILLWAYKNLDGREKVKDNPLEELNELYVEANSRIETDPSLRDVAKLEFVKLEEGDKENRKLWEFFISVSRKEFDKISQSLELLPFEYDLGESFYEDLMKEIVSELEAANLIKIGETGEKYVDLEEWKLGRLICQKSDRGTTYGLRDMATVKYRYETLSKKERLPLVHNIYVVDNRQSHHLRQVFKAMELLGYDVSKSSHVDFGFLSLPEGAMSTRKGTVVRAEVFLEEAHKKALQIINEKNPNIANKEAVATKVALGAIKYADLSHNRSSDITFRWETALSFEGNTGPYLQYTYARLNSIVRKAQDEFIKTPITKEVLIDPTEQEVARRLSHFPEIVSQAAREFMPSTLATYLYELAGAVNHFYQAVPVLIEEDEAKRCARLSLVSASAAALKNGLYLLGIEAPEEM